MVKFEDYIKILELQHYIIEIWTLFYKEINETKSFERSDSTNSFS